MRLDVRAKDQMGGEMVLQKSLPPFVVRNSRDEHHAFESKMISVLQADVHQEAAELASILASAELGLVLCQ